MELANSASSDPGGGARRRSTNAAGSAASPRSSPTSRASSTASSSASARRTELLFKVLVIGELGCGKTSFIKRYVHQFFSEHYRATIGVDFALKVLNWNDDTVVRLQLWDIAGQERFGNMTRVYYKDAVGAFLLFDLTRADTFKAVEKWKEDLDSKVLLPDGRPIPCVLVGNKCDQPASGMAANNDRVDAFAREKGFRGWFAASARDNINVEEAARHLVETIFEERRRAEESGGTGLGLGGGAGALSARRGRDVADASGGGPRILMLEEEGSGGGGARGGDCKC